jgi:hypothetical protein
LSATSRFSRFKLPDPQIFLCASFGGGKLPAILIPRMSWLNLCGQSDFEGRECQEPGCAVVRVEQVWLQLIQGSFRTCESVAVGPGTTLSQVVGQVEEAGGGGIKRLDFESAKHLSITITRLNQCSGVFVVNNSGLVCGAAGGRVGEGHAAEQDCCQAGSSTRKWVSLGGRH